MLTECIIVQLDERDRIVEKRKVNWCYGEEGYHR